MYYYSDYYKSCTTHDSGWCNIPNKKHLNPTEQMIVAYHKGTIVYAYKGIFNYNIDHDWTGGVLVDFRKIVDKCKLNQNIQPAPSSFSKTYEILGITFDKANPYDYLKNFDTTYGSLDSPQECQWHNCGLPSHISSSTHNMQQTVAIYVH